MLLLLPPFSLFIRVCEVRNIIINFQLNKMKHYLCTFFFLLLSGFSLFGQDDVKYVEGQELAVIGKFHNEAGYARFPARYKDKLRSEVWSIGQRSTGISIFFESNASQINVRWTLAGEYTMLHTNTSGARGVDLYVEANGKWHYVQTGAPTGKTSEATLTSGEKPVMRKYLVNLPLNINVESIYIGVNKEAELRKPQTSLFAQKPIVHYGSSITQSATASRPGMAYTNILSRWLNRPIINMGFSGQGTFDDSVGDAMCETDAALYIVDCSPNTQDSLICERAINLVNQLKKCRPDVPVLLVENYLYAIGYFRSNYPENNEIPNRKQIELQKAYDQLIQSGVKNLYYQKGKDLIGTDQEGTMDGAHPNDLGLYRYAETIYPTIQNILNQ